jgi:hypothetical protein
MQFGVLMCEVLMDDDPLIDSPLLTTAHIGMSA